MKVVWLCMLMVGILGVASAQTKTTMTGTCAKSDVQQSVPAGDQQGHSFTVAQGKCSVTGSVNGAVAKQAAYSEHADADGNQMKNWGVFAVTFDSGDKVYYKYQGSGTTADGAFQQGTNKYQVEGGTGKMQGVTGSGTCKLNGTKDGGVSYSCTGSYSMGPATGNNSRGQGRSPTPRQTPSNPHQ